MFGSRLQAALAAADHQVELIGNEKALRDRLSDGDDGDAGTLIVDLTDDRFDGAGTLEALRTEGLLGSSRALAFYSHVETDVRERAQQAGFDLVVPRSRIAREASTLVASLNGD